MKRSNGVDYKKMERDITRNDKTIIYPASGGRWAAGINK
jgi:hypothetical protein